MKKLRHAETLVCQPSLFHILLAKLIVEEPHLAIFLERSPVAAYCAIVCYDGLEDAAVVVGVVPVLLR